MTQSLNTNVSGVDFCLCKSFWYVSENLRHIKESSKTGANKLLRFSRYVTIKCKVTFTQNIFIFFNYE